MVTALLLSLTTQASILEEVVVTANRADQTVADVSSNISVLTAEKLAAINHTHINEAMQRIAGVWVSRGNGQEHLTALRSPRLNRCRCLWRFFNGAGRYTTARQRILQRQRIV